MNLLDEAVAADPAIDNQLPTPSVVDATDDIVNLDAPFTVELPALDSDSYSDVLLWFVNTDGSDSPQCLIHRQPVSGEPARGMVDNNALSPAFDRDQSAVVRCYIKQRQSGRWLRTPDSAFYTF